MLIYTTIDEYYKPRCEALTPTQVNIVEMISAKPQSAKEIVKTDASGILRGENMKKTNIAKVHKIEGRGFCRIPKVVVSTSDPADGDYSVFHRLEDEGFPQDTSETLQFEGCLYEHFTDLSEEEAIEKYGDLNNVLGEVEVWSAATPRHPCNPKEISRW